MPNVKKSIKVFLISCYAGLAVKESSKWRKKAILSRMAKKLITQNHTRKQTLPLWQYAKPRQIKSVLQRNELLNCMSFLPTNDHQP